MKRTEAIILRDQAGAIPIKGPKGTATIYLEATTKLGAWHYDRLVVDIEATHERIDLIKRTSEPGDQIESR